jgi:hypothetical protein
MQLALRHYAVDLDYSCSQYAEAIGLILSALKQVHNSLGKQENLVDSIAVKPQGQQSEETKGNATELKGLTREQWIRSVAHELGFETCTEEGQKNRMAYAESLAQSYYDDDPTEYTPHQALLEDATYA